MGQEMSSHPLKLLLCLGNPSSRMTHGSFGPPISASRMALWSVQPFCRTHGCDQQTHRPCYTCNNRQHQCYSSRCNTLHIRGVYRTSETGACFGRLSAPNNWSITDCLFQDASSFNKNHVVPIPIVKWPIPIIGNLADNRLTLIIGQ